MAMLNNQMVLYTDILYEVSNDVGSSKKIDESPLISVYQWTFAVY